MFNKQYPHLPGYAKVIDNYMTYAQSAIDEFSDPQKLPQIAISVDMLDTGIDVPEVLNLCLLYTSRGIPSMRGWRSAKTPIPTCTDWRNTESKSMMRPAMSGMSMWKRRSKM